MKRITDEKNLGKVGFYEPTGEVFLAVVSFKKESGYDVTCVKWKKITGHRGASISSRIRNYNLKEYDGNEIIFIEDIV